MKINRKIFAFAAVAILAAGCKKYTDVNVSPNSPENVELEQLLPAAELSLGQTYGNYLAILGGVWGQYWTQNPNANQYRQLEQYQPGPSSASTAWQELYAGCLTDLRKIQEKGDTALNTRNYTAIAMILEGFTFQVLTDAFGDIPYTEALRGEEGITSPKYDPQRAIYESITQTVIRGRDLITLEGAHPGSDDVIYNGNMDLWYRFANTLLLKMYLRLYHVDQNFAKTGIEQLQTNGGGFLDVGETGQIKYFNAAGSFNPLYSEQVNLNRTQNLIASATGMNAFFNRADTFFNGYLDPRIDVAYYYNGTNYNSLQQGYYDIPNPTSYALPGPTTGGIANPDVTDIDNAQQVVATAPVILISSYESLFLQAEAQARVLLAGTASETYANAIKASFEDNGLFSTNGLTQVALDDTTIIEVPTDSLNRAFVDQNYLTYISPYPTGDAETQVEQIITEKWVAMNGHQNFEAWTEWRRTGYPDIFTVSKNSRIGSDYPVRIPYPETEVTRNLNFPGQPSITQNVYWDKD